MQEQRNAGEQVTQSLHDRIVSDIRDRILSGDLEPGHRIPSEMELAGRYACSRMTINKALTQLARDGYVERRRRAGTFVRRPQVQSAIVEIPDIKTEITNLRLPYRFTLLGRSVAPDTSINHERLGIGPTDPVLSLSCLHFADDAPFCLETRLINLTAVPEAETVDFSVVSPGSWLLEQVPWQEAEHTITAIGADRKLAAHLDIPEHAPCLSVERRTWNSSHIVTFVRIIYPGASHAFVARFAPS